MPKTSRHGKRAAGMTVVSIPMSAALKSAIKEIAQRDSRTAAAWVRHQLQNVVRRSQAATRKAA